MKQILTVTLVIVCGIRVIAQPHNLMKGNCTLGVELNASYSKAAALDSILQHYTTGMLPGASLALYSELNGWWAASRGYANIEKKIAMENCHLQYIQSVSKSYMAVEILQLSEQGRINIEAPVNRYLPPNYCRYIPDAGKITIRMLLNHTSGVPEYNDNPRFLSQVVQHPLDFFSAEDCLRSIAKEPLRFVPGSKYVYTNTNYLLLSLIGDAITGDHAAYIREHIFKPLGLVNTYYGLGHDYLRGANLPASYWDVFGNGKCVDITEFQKETVLSSKGDDGIVCTPVDAVKYLKGLMEGKLLNKASMKEMFNFVKDEKGNNRYGMGMIYFDLGDLVAYGHGGGGIGAGCGLMYIPSHKTYVFFSTNLGVLIESDLVKKADELKTAILATILQ